MNEEKLTPEDEVNPQQEKPQASTARKNSSLAGRNGQDKQDLLCTALL